MQDSGLLSAVLLSAVLLSDVWETCWHWAERPSSLRMKSEFFYYRYLFQGPL